MAQHGVRSERLLGKLQASRARCLLAKSGRTGDWGSGTCATERDGGYTTAGRLMRRRVAEKVRPLSCKPCTSASKRTFGTCCVESTRDEEFGEELWFCVFCCDLKTMTRRDETRGRRFVSRRRRWCRACRALLSPLDDFLNRVEHVLLADRLAARSDREHAGLGANAPQLGTGRVGAEPRE
jgi:hypothetical protein